MSKSIKQKLKSCFYEFVRDEEGYHLVDRNGAYFAYILDFLRDSKIVLPQDPAEIKKILKEANFFAVQVNFVQIFHKNYQTLPFLSIFHTLLFLNLPLGAN